MIILSIGICLVIIGSIILIGSFRRLSQAREMLDAANSSRIDNRYALQTKERLERDIEFLTANIRRLQLQESEISKSVDDYYNREQAKVTAQIERLKSTIHTAASQYADNLDLAYEAAEKEFDDKLSLLTNQLSQKEEELNKLKSSLVAATQARLREEEKKQQLDFYKLQVTNSELDDIKILDGLKSRLHQPVILSKLIWSTYFQKQTKALCSRVLGEQTICGIYKITDLTTEQCYVGQSVDIAKRWTDHTKCGLGIEGSDTNKLYRAMRQDGVWNFTYELLEECPREQLDEKERFFINLYQSDVYGYNSTHGNK